MTQASGGRRRLTDAEIALWLAVAGTVRPRKGARLPAAPPAAVPLAQAPRPPPLPMPPGRDGPVPFLPPYVPPVSGPRAGVPPLAPLEKRLRQRITRGQVDIDAAIDLHGMTQPEAHAALLGFLRTRAAGGARLVLVVTGKGRPRLAVGTGETGVLRRAVPQWLRADELRGVVMGFEEAGLLHGGMGALYVRLRRRG